MNAGPDVERLIAGWLHEEAPGRAPDRILEGAGRTIDRTHQRRFVAEWRESMLGMRGLAAVAVIGAIVVGAFYLARPSLGPGNQPITSPTAASSASTVPATAEPTVAPNTVSPSRSAAIPPGTYRAEPISVAAILADLDDEPDLSAEQMTAIVDELLSIRDAEVLDIELVISADAFVFRQGTDGGSMYTNQAWRLFAIDENTIAVRGPDSGQLLGYNVLWSDGSFTLRPVSPSPGGVGGFALRIMLESKPFTPVP